ITAYLGLALVLALVLYAHRQISARKSARARRRGLTGTAIIALVFGMSWAACTLAQSGPIVVTRNGQQIHDVEIWAENQAGIITNGFLVSIWSAVIHHKGSAGIYISPGSHVHLNAVNIAGAPDHGGGANISCLGASLTADNIRVSKGQSGIWGDRCNMQLTHVEGQDQWGKYQHGAGPFVEWITSTV